MLSGAPAAKVVDHHPRRVGAAGLGRRVRYQSRSGEEGEIAL
jgi:hypothetical protein